MINRPDVERVTYVHRIYCLYSASARLTRFLSVVSGDGRRRERLRRRVGRRHEFRLGPRRRRRDEVRADAGEPVGLDHALRRDDSAGHPAEPALHRGRAVHAEDAHHRLLPPAQPQPARHPRRGALRPLHPRLGDHRADVELRVAGTDLPVEFSPF